MWYQIEVIGSHRDQVELLSTAFEETGALSITYTDRYDDPVLEPAPGAMPLWPEVVVHALFNERLHAEAAMMLLEPQFAEYSFSLSDLPDQDWERAWMDDFKPQCFGKRLWICPSWLTPPEPDAVNLILDPGLAFGTGTHPTTSLCLQWLDAAELSDKKLVDFGCGSGILALAALKLGAQHVHAMDIDDQALIATHNNALTNNLAADTRLSITKPEAITATVDIVLANILLAPLMSLKNEFKALLKPGGTLVVSGILNEQVEPLIEEYQGLFEKIAVHTQEDWSLIEFRLC